MTPLGSRSSRPRRSVLLEQTWPERPAVDAGGGSPVVGSRIVVECHDSAISEAAAHVLRDAGHEVAVCAGPDEGHWCPLLDGGRCALVEDGDLVVNLLGFGDADRREVLPLLRARYPDIPVMAEASTGERDEHAAVMEGVYVIDSPIRRDRLLAQVAAAESTA